MKKKLTVSGIVVWAIIHHPHPPSFIISLVVCFPQAHPLLVIPSCSSRHLCRCSWCCGCRAFNTLKKDVEPLIIITKISKKKKSYWEYGPK